MDVCVLWREITFTGPWPRHKDLFSIILSGPTKKALRAYSLVRKHAAAEQAKSGFSKFLAGLASLVTMATEMTCG